MSERYCPSCGRPLPWEITKADGTRVLAPGCYEAPEEYAANSVERFASITCRGWEAIEAADDEMTKRTGEARR